MSYSAFGSPILPQHPGAASTSTPFTQQTISSPKSKKSSDSPRNYHHHNHHPQTSPQVIGAAAHQSLYTASSHTSHTNPPSALGGGGGADTAMSTSHKTHNEDQLLWAQLELQLEQERSRSRETILRTMAKKLMKLQDKSDENRILTALMSVQLDEQVSRLVVVQDSFEVFSGIANMYASAIQRVLINEQHKNKTLRIELHNNKEEMMIDNTMNLITATTTDGGSSKGNQLELEGGALLLEKPSNKASSTEQPSPSSQQQHQQQSPSRPHPSIRRSSAAPSSPSRYGGTSPLQSSSNGGGGSPTMSHNQQEQHRYFIPEKRSAFSEYGNNTTNNNTTLSHEDEEAELNRRFDNGSFRENIPNRHQPHPHLGGGHHYYDVESDVIRDEHKQHLQHNIDTILGKGSVDQQQERRSSYNSTSSVGGLINTPRRVVNGGGGTPTMIPTQRTPIPHIELGNLNLSQHENNTPVQQQQQLQPLPIITTTTPRAGATDSSRRHHQRQLATTPRNTNVVDVHSRLELLLFKERYHLEEYSEAVARASLVKAEIHEWNDITSTHQQEGWSAECIRMAEYYDGEIGTLEATIWAKAQEHFGERMAEFKEASMHKSEAETQTLTLLQEEMVARRQLESYMLFGSTTSRINSTIVVGEGSVEKEEEDGAAPTSDKEDQQQQQYTTSHGIEVVNVEDNNKNDNSGPNNNVGLLGIFRMASVELNRYLKQEAIQATTLECKQSVDEMKAKVERSLYNNIVTRQECKKEVQQTEEDARQITNTMTKLHTSQLVEVQTELSAAKSQLVESSRQSEQLRVHIVCLEEDLASAKNSLSDSSSTTQKAVATLLDKLSVLESDLAAAVREKTSLAIDHKATILEVQKNFEEKDRDRMLTINDLRQTITLQNENIHQGKVELEAIKASHENSYSTQISAIADDVEWRLAGIEGRMSLLLAEVDMVVQSPSAPTSGASPTHRINHALETFQEHFDVLFTTLSETAKELRQERDEKEESSQQKIDQNTQTDPLLDHEDTCKCNITTAVPTSSMTKDDDDDGGIHTDVPPTPTTTINTTNINPDNSNNGSFPSHLVLSPGGGGGGYIRHPILCEGCQCRISVSPPVLGNNNATTLHGMVVSVSGTGSRENSQNVISYSPSSNYNSTPPQAVFHARNNSNISAGGGGGEGGAASSMGVVSSGYDNMSFGQVSTNTTAAPALGLPQPVLRVNTLAMSSSFDNPLFKILEEEESAARMHIAFAAASVVKFSTPSRSSGKYDYSAEAGAASTSSGPSLQCTPNRVPTVLPTHRQRSNTTPANMSPPPQPITQAIHTSDHLDEPISPPPRQLSSVLPNPPSVTDFYTSATPNAVMGSAEDLTTSTVAAHTSFYQLSVTNNNTPPPGGVVAEEEGEGSSSTECPRIPTTTTFGSIPINQPPFYAGGKKKRRHGGGGGDDGDDGGVFSEWFEGVREIIHHWSEEQLYSQLAPTLEELEQNYEIVRAQVRQQQQPFGTSNTARPLTSTTDNNLVQ